MHFHVVDMDSDIDGAVPHCSNINISNLTLLGENFSFAQISTGIHINKASNVVITGNIITHASVAGIAVGSDCDNVVISNNICSDGASWHGDGISLHHNTSRRVIVSGNVCHRNNRGIDIGSSGATIVGNDCQDNTEGIRLTANAHNIISGNLCKRGNGAAGGYANHHHTINIAFGAQNNFIIANHIPGKAVNNASGNTTNTVTQNKHLATATGW